MGQSCGLAASITGSRCPTAASWSRAPPVLPAHPGEHRGPGETGGAGTGKPLVSDLDHPLAGREALRGGAEVKAAGRQAGVDRDYVLGVLAGMPTAWSY